MIVLIMLYTIVSIIGGCILLWFKTPSGKKWLRGE